MFDIVGIEITVKKIYIHNSMLRNCKVSLVISVRNIKCFVQAIGADIILCYKCSGVSMWLKYNF